MQCQNCHAELDDHSSLCPECGYPVPHPVEGFEHAVVVQQILKTIIDQNGRGIIARTRRLVSMLKDYLPDYEAERRLLVYAVNSGVLKYMLDDSDKSVAVMRTRSAILDECFLSDRAAEFAIACFTYMLGWQYDNAAAVRPTPVPVQAASAPAQSAPAAATVLTEKKLFSRSDAGKFRLTRNVVVPEGYTMLESFAFDKFGFMRTVVLPETMIAVGEFAFSECKRLKSVTLPASLRKMERNVFSQCVNLASVKIPDGVLEIADNTFFYCTSLEVVDLPASISSIGAQAFSGCEKLRTLFVPESVKFIDKGAFAYCPELTVRCYENSYVHKYCLANGIPTETVVFGADLRAKQIQGG